MSRAKARRAARARPQVELWRDSRCARSAPKDAPRPLGRGPVAGGVEGRAGPGLGLLAAAAAEVGGGRLGGEADAAAAAADRRLAPGLVGDGVRAAAAVERRLVGSGERPRSPAAASSHPDFLLGLGREGAPPPRHGCAPLACGDRLRGGDMLPEAVVTTFFPFPALLGAAGGADGSAEGGACDGAFVAAAVPAAAAPPPSSGIVAATSVPMEWRFPAALDALSSASSARSCAQSATGAITLSSPSSVAHCGGGSWTEENECGG